MKQISISTTNLSVSNVAMGCMRIPSLSEEGLSKLIHTALEQGVNFFDHADIYGKGESEALFGNFLEKNHSLREAMILQSKCGIRNGYFDFSKDYIVSCVDNSLKRLHTDYLDILLLHRPDMLMEPEEVAAAFDQLYTSGKVRYFGVSNHTPNQIALLQKYCTQKIVINQLQLSAAHTLLFDANIALNMANDQGINRDSGVLDYCRLHDITIQAWSPFQKSSKGIFLGDFEHFGELNQKIEELAKKYEVSTSAIAVAFITRHPANIQVILGTTNCDRMIESCQGSDIPLTREEWYGLYKASGHIVP